MKKWLSRGIVLAMIVAMMVPAPVLAKSSKKGGKLPKSVTEYSYTSAGRWQAEKKTTYSYDKKNNPVQFERVKYDNHFLGVPVSGEKKVTTAKYKYKGSKAKSAKFKDGAGMVYQTRKYKKGRVVSISETSKTSYEVTDDDTDAYKGDNVYVDDSFSGITYNKSGLATSYTYAWTENNTYVGGSSYSGNGSSSYVFAIASKKGIPSLITDTYAGGNDNGTAIPADTTPTVYTKYNAKGLAVENGRINSKGVYVPDTYIVYTSKKGKVTTATVYDVTTDSTGAVTKTTPTTLYKFKYTKKKASAVRYLSMVNSFVGSSAGFFAWY